MNFYWRRVESQEKLQRRGNSVHNITLVGFRGQKLEIRSGSHPDWLRDQRVSAVKIFLIISKDEANSWCKEIRKLLGPPGPGKEIRNSRGNHPISARIWVFLDLWCSGEAKGKKPPPNFSFPFFFWKYRFWYINT